MRRWLRGEPSLSDILQDPVVQLVMRRDRVDPDRLRALLRELSGARSAAALPGLPDLGPPTGDARHR